MSPGTAYLVKRAMMISKWVYKFILYKNEQSINTYPQVS